VKNSDVVPRCDATTRFDLIFQRSQIVKRYRVKVELPASYSTPRQIPLSDALDNVRQPEVGTAPSSALRLKGEM
jgi:hypothetical protein